MRMKIKKCVGSSWLPVSAYDMLGTTMIDYMINNKHRIICSVFEDDKHEPFLLLVNSEKDLANFKGKFTTLFAQDMKKIMSGNLYPKVVIDVFPDSDLIEARSI